MIVAHVCHVSSSVKAFQDLLNILLANLYNTIQVSSNLRLD